MKKKKKVIEHLKGDMKTFTKEKAEDKELIKELKEKKKKKKKKK
jgi:hypothetical protein